MRRVARSISKRALWIGVLGLLTAVNGAWAQSGDGNRRGDGDNRRNPILDDADRNASTPGVSPARRISRDGPVLSDGLVNPDIRSADGHGNNLANPDVAAAHIHLLRIAPPAYGDGAAELSGADRPGARQVSNGVMDQDELRPNVFNTSDYIWQWGQFLDHDLDLTDGIDPPEPADILVPVGDPLFDPSASGTATIAFNRSLYDLGTGTGPENPREQVNEITGWIDGSNVYGSDEVRAEALRMMDGSGRLRVSAGNLLPFNTEGLANAGGPSAELFLAGDVRANEQIGLTVMHTLFVREHNWQADRIREDNPGLSGEEIYQQARSRVIAELQVITYREYLPTLLGRGALPRYRGYRRQLDASISNTFATAAFRYGHSTLSPQILRLEGDGEPIEAGHLALRDAFFSPRRLLDEGGIEPILRGLASQVSQAVDVYVIDDVRNFLFGPPGAGGFDLVALNIQRGRDHGLPSYNEVRRAFGLETVTRFDEISSDPDVISRLAATYGQVDLVDPWVGGLAEDHRPGAMVGELIYTVLVDQFVALRDGDRFWYENVMSGSELDAVRRTRLSDLIRRNTEIGDELQDNVFQVGRRGAGSRGERAL